MYYLITFSWGLGEDPRTSELSCTERDGISLSASSAPVGRGKRTEPDEVSSAKPSFSPRSESAPLVGLRVHIQRSIALAQQAPQACAKRAHRPYEVVACTLSTRSARAHQVHKVVCVHIKAKRTRAR